MKILITGNFIHSESYAPYQRIINLMKMIELKGKQPVDLELQSLNGFISGSRIIFFYPIFFFLILIKTWSLLRPIIKKREPQVVYFYGRNASMFIPVFILCKLHKIKIMVDHVENPIYRYKISIFFSWLRFDQFLGYPLMWIFSDLNVYISKAYEKSILFRKSNSVFVPVIIGQLQAPKMLTVDSISQYQFVLISSLIERDNILKLMEFINMFQETALVKFSILGRFKNEKIQRNLEKKSNVSLYNNAAEEVKCELMDAANCYVIFRNFNKAELYSSPTRLAEFISYNKPIIVNDSNFVKEVVGETKDGFCEWQSDDSHISLIQKLKKIKPFDLRFYDSNMNMAIAKIVKILEI